MLVIRRRDSSASNMAVSAKGCVRWYTCTGGIYATSLQTRREIACFAPAPVPAILLPMEIRPLTSADLRFLGDIDATIESTQYLHLERSGEGVTVNMRVESRPLREKKIISNPINDDL